METSVSHASVLRIALFGLGRAGRIHVRNIVSHPNVSLIAIVELPNVEASLSPDLRHLLPGNAARVDATDTEAVDELLASDRLDAVLIASPTATHYDLTIRALGQSKHVLVEKPLAESLEHIHECFDAAEASKCVLSIGYNRRYDPAIRRLKAQMESGVIGVPRTALTIARDYPYPGAAFLSTCGGLFHDCATHDIDYLSWLLDDKPLSVQATVPHNTDTADFNVDHCVIQLQYSKGTLATLHLSRVASNYDQRCEIFGDKGEARMVDFIPDAKTSFPQRYADAFKAELDAFVASVAGKQPALVTRSDVVRAFCVAEACAMSLTKRNVVTVRYPNRDTTSVEDTFRQYETAPERVKDNYRIARVRQTVQFVDRMLETYAPLDRKMDIWTILEQLNDLVDVSDPDLAHPNLYHAFQTAEAMRSDGLPDWMQLMGLLHDAGKIMYMRGCDEDGTSRIQQWAMVGDTFVVGCGLPKSLVYSEFNDLNPDMKNSMYNTVCGRYPPGCGLDQVQCSWGHDEYLYRILASGKNPHTLPEAALYMARFHSLYAYHRDGGYTELMSEKDHRLLPELKKFNKYDLYSKSDTLLDIDALRPYYTTLIDKYFGRRYWWI